MQLVSFAAQYLLIGLLYYFLFRLVAVLRAELTDTLASEGVIPSKAAKLQEKVEEPLQLVVLHSIAVRKGERFILGKPAISLGRADDNDIVLADPYVSKHHAAIRLVDGKHQISDLGSSNGTLLNGRPLTAPAVLKVGDKIQVGDTVLSCEKVR